MKSLFSVQQKYSSDFKNNFSDEFYHIFLFEGTGTLLIDLVEYNFSGKNILFTSPYQNIQIQSETDFEIDFLNFHGDYYCIEYHKKEVACNGLLFNNIYLFPHFELDKHQFKEISEILKKIKNINQNENFSDAVLKSYLQLILALSSQKKNQLLIENNFSTEEFSEFKTFQNLVEEHFRLKRSPAFYADLMHISANTLSKKIKKEFNKTPSQIIQERVILEAKKQIHLTRKSIKEIAAELNFEDEFYFSKYFKKLVGVSPSQFREEVGISVVADL